MESVANAQAQLSLAPTRGSKRHPDACYRVYDAWVRQPALGVAEFKELIRKAQWLDVQPGALDKVKRKLPPR